MVAMKSAYPGIALPTFVTCRVSASFERYILILVLLCAPGTQAGGLWLNEFGDFSGGRASAGAAAGTDDAATIIHNPASATRLDSKQLFIAAGLLAPRAKFETQYSNPVNGFINPGDAGRSEPFGSIAYTQDLSDSPWSTGFYITAPAGAKLKYGSTWSGRYQAEDVFFVIATAASSLSYAATDQLSLGFALQVYYADLKITSAVPRASPAQPDGRATVDGTDVGFGFSAGALYEFSERYRLGITYQSELKPDFGGSIKLRFPTSPPPESSDLQVAANTELVMAEYLRLALHHSINQDWSVDLTLGWDNWSALKNVLLSTQVGSLGIPTKWRDTYHYAIGAQYRLTPQWTFTSGIAYDTNPVSAQKRTAQRPVDRQIRMAVGARYAVNTQLNFGGYINYIDLGKARIETSAFGGKFVENDVWQLMVNVSWLF
ncbi:MAG: outer membrane protein transport protein [Pseudomonadota bacterium]